MLKDEMERALNEQLKWEIYSGYLYLSMAAYFENLGLQGFSQWMKAQSAEEIMHAMKFYKFIFERDGKVVLQEIPAPPKEWKNPEEVFEFAYKHEQEVTGRINNLMSLAKKLEDYATENFLQWFVEEQVEEEASFKEILSKLRLIKNDPQGLFYLDKELSQRPLDFNLLMTQV
ncbi:MAG: ferritin [Thermodesulfobacterium geofontis]|uniref:Ferritin n=1 Tax=Thermodesulfobacterium geofontis TaxID=1295609 RepID=A0A2N7QFQ0_9BACT|nr:MAG: ferritin [Thermodesulfobacterium geofontis]PMP97725.1 MAG: ferritin [Thermodesulfobacterium geofontis]HEM56448.1 ferritin [Thermodesulfobium narugense]